MSLEVTRAKFSEHLSAASKILELGEKSLVSSDTAEKDDLSRESRGLCMVILFAGYERLIKSVCRDVLENLKLQSGQIGDLNRGYRTLAMASAWQSVDATKKSDYWTAFSENFVHGLSRDLDTINANEFPSDGSFMSQSQVSLVCKLFGFSGSQRKLGRTWQDISDVRRRRNQVAHGEATAAEVGRDITYAEAVDLVARWDKGWNDFLDHVENLVSDPNVFFREEPS